jgi:allantoin racemase
MTPYQASGVNYDPQQGHYMVRGIIENLRRRGQLEGVEIDIDEGYPTDPAGQKRDEEVLANITPGFLKRVREISESGKYDAMVTSGAIEPGFFAGRMIAKIPIAFCVHSAVHVASYLGERFSIIQAHDAGALIVRHLVQLYGLGDKLVSVRHVSNPSKAPHFVRQYGLEYQRKGEADTPEVHELVQSLTDEAITAIEEDRVDTIILGGPYFELLEDHVRRKLDEAGYEEIPLVGELASAIEMAKAMVSMRLKQAARAYPSGTLKVKPRFR